MSEETFYEDFNHVLTGEPGVSEGVPVAFVHQNLMKKRGDIRSKDVFEDLEKEENCGDVVCQIRAAQDEVVERNSAH